MERAGIVFLSVLLVLVVGSGSPASAGRSTIPSELLDVDGAAIDVAGLARRKKLFFVTIKATWCPVCRAQLRRLGEQLPRLRSCDASFIVRSPGPREKIVEVRNETGFPFPFVEDPELALAQWIGLRLSAQEMVPAIFAVDENRDVAWMQQGRSGLYFGDPELLEYLDCATLGLASVKRLERWSVRRRSNLGQQREILRDISDSLYAATPRRLGCPFFCV